FSLSALKEIKTCTFLSLLGITIGIMTIIGVFSAVYTLRSNLEKSVEKLGSRSIYVAKWPCDVVHDYHWLKFLNRPEPSYRDFQQLRSRLTLADGICYTTNVSERTLKFLNNNVEGVVVMGVSYDFYKIRSLLFQQGRYFTEIESNNASPVVLI